MTGGDSCVLQVWDISKKDPTSITANAVTKLSTFKHAFYSNVHKGKVAFTSVHSNEIKILDGEKQLSPIPILDEGEVKTTKGISLMEDRVFLAYELEDQSFVDSYTLVDGKKALTQSFGDKIFFICVDKDYLVINQKDALKILDPHSLEIKRSLDFPNNEKKSLKIVEINHDEVVAVVHKTIFLWDVHTGKLSQTWTMDDPIRHISLSEDFVAIVSEYDMSSAKTTIWHRKSGQLVKEITCKDVPASVALELNPQYKMLAIGMRNGQLELRSYPPTKV
jgi:WD40 repeat protein